MRMSLTVGISAKHPGKLLWLLAMTEDDESTPERLWGGLVLMQDEPAAAYISALEDASLALQRAYFGFESPRLF